MLDQYEEHEPVLLYTDGAIPFSEVGRSMLANYYYIARHGWLEAVYCLNDMRKRDKTNSRYHGEYVEGIGVQDMEGGVIDDIKTEPWQTDTCIGGWYYNSFKEYETVR